MVTRLTGKSPAKGFVKYGFALAALAAMALLPYALSRYYLYFLGTILVMGLLATSLNIVLGYGGMYQFHHAVFYGTGAYAFSLGLTKGGWPFWVSFLAAPVTAAILGLVMGVICVRLSKLYFGMLQISLGSLVWALAYRWYSFTGGDDGIHGVPMPDFLGKPAAVYFFILITVAVCLFLMYRIVSSPFGKIFQAIRDNTVRSEAIGVNVERQQLIGLVLAAFFAGIAGALFVVIENSVVPDLLFWNLSLEILIMCLLGGWFNFFGPMIGAAVMMGLRTFAGMHTEYWTMILGIILMILIFFLPNGILGLMDRNAARGGEGEAE